MANWEVCLWRFNESASSDDGPLEMNCVGYSPELPSDCSFDLTLVS